MEKTRLKIQQKLQQKRLRTPDVNIERLNRLKSLLPDLFTIEGRLDIAELKRLETLGNSENEAPLPPGEHFEFKWFGKHNAKHKAFSSSTGTLVYDDKRSVHPQHANGNMIIEGENLETLKCLLAAYRGTVKCIYIDPPYNTGKDFIYSDKWAEGKADYWEQIGVTEKGIRLDTHGEATGRFHSNWLNMIYPRLLLAREFLRDDGVILISIDDHEVHHLRKVCDEVFHEENFITQLVWTTKKGAQGMETRHRLVSNHEYVLVYSKCTDFKFRGIERTVEGFANPDNDSRGPWKRQQMQRLGQGLPKRTLIDPATGNRFSFETPYTQQKLDDWLREDRILFPADDKKYPIRKEFLAEYENKKQLVSSLGLYATKAGTQKLYSLFADEKIFSNPKPDTLLKFLINVTTEKDDLILDFFAGSGTTAQAVIECNHEEGSNRKFILIQLPEAISDETSAAYEVGYRKISDITIARTKYVIKNIQATERVVATSSENNADSSPAKQRSSSQLNSSRTNQQKLPGKAEFNVEFAPGFSVGFSVYCLAKSYFPRVTFKPDPHRSETENIALLEKYIAMKEESLLVMRDQTTERNVCDEVLLKQGFKLHYTKTSLGDLPYNRVYRVKDEHRECLICLDKRIKPETVKYLKKVKQDRFICLESALDPTLKWYLSDLFGTRLLAL